MIYIGGYKKILLHLLQINNILTTFNTIITAFISHFAFMLLICLFFVGCSSKNDVVVEYKEVYIPVKCNEQMPIKPQLNNNDLESVKALAEYYVECEIKLKSCLGIN